VCLLHFVCRAKVVPYIQRCSEKMQRLEALGRFVEEAAMDCSPEELQEAEVHIELLRPKLAEFGNLKSLVEPNT
jgi:hypothetical protein